ncbi:ATP-dependent helicase HrpB [Parasedimentitalea psychrophila]|uniref:ATP-dependent helicase HrpB n=1 Tax=Parasedimentitalea psychrophila TaxID=2997337 RepID=A0A9Y2P2S2_9RHOB|nr:ATP-dependent helicase HrpB [Parasedimentitalea psychrophila]WIY23519.1 ATP-dependent helicase HrpB [Parasedimentitalea psychrophila]
MTKLPIDTVLPELISALRAHGRAVLQAPPGAGKTTRVPLAMLEAGLTKGRIVMLEPRRLAARAAAERMAETLGERTGETVGYRVRGDAKVSRATRIEVVTEGILTRMLQSNPDLPGVGAVIFDEFHERSLNADFGLALCLEVADALRDDLILMAMSATLDAGPVAELMQAPMVTSQGRSYDVETRWLDRPIATQGPRGQTGAASARARRLDALVDLVQQAEKDTRGTGGDTGGDTGGGILVFLPGEGEIRRTASALAAKLPETCVLRPLFGALPFAEQRAAIAPVKSGRKVVLATSIAETSLTIQDIRVVVDMGQARRARFDPGSGMSRLITEKVTRAEATQRRGRAGRVAEGICYRLWTKGEEGALAAFPPAEIEAADLTSLALELALWGAAASDLSFLTPPPEGAMTEAQALLRMLGALDAQGRITGHGKALATLPLHPRLAHMLVTGGSEAAQLAALMAERDPLRGAPSDLLLRMQAMRDPKGFLRKRPYQLNLPVVERIKAETRRLQRQGTERLRLDAALAPAAMAALAYPDRIGQRRKGDTPRYVLSGGKGVVLEDSDTLAAAPFIVVLDSDGNLREARVRMAAQISQGEIRALFGDQISWHATCDWSKRERRVVARKQERFGAVVLDDQVWKDVPAEAVAAAMLDGVRELGLRLTGAAARLAARVELVRAEGHALPDFSIQGLTDSLGDWLLPMLSGVKTADDWKRFDLLPALRAALDWGQTQLLDREAASHFTTPLGNRIPITYAEAGPEIELRIQELFGVTRHPASGGVPLKITLLSPARRPIQITRDLPGFWTGSYSDVRKDMRAQYPRHPWPEDPTQADPTLRAKRRKP